MLTGRIVDVDRAELGSVRSWFARLDEPHRRTGGALGAAPGDAHSGASVRHGPHDRRGAGAHGRLARAGVSLFVRHARRVGAHARGCGASTSRSIARPSSRSGATCSRRSDIAARHSISVKLSALHPRYELAQSERVMQRAGAAAACAREARARVGDRAHGRCGRGGAARAVVAADRLGARERCAGWLRGLRARGAGVSAARVQRARMARGALRAG